VSIDDDTIVESVAQALRLSAVENPENRWYDRASSQIVSRNGVSMYQGEHSPMDAIVCATTPVDIVSKFSEDVKETGEVLKKMNCSTPGDLPHQHQFDASVDGDDRRQVQSSIEICQWVIPEPVQLMLLNAYAYHTGVAAGCHIAAFQNTRFGKATLRKHRVHVDFLCQLAIQMAHCVDCAACEARGDKRSTSVDVREAVRRHFVATYESASTRVFQQGRTETVRSATLEMRHLIELIIPMIFPSFPVISEVAPAPNREWCETGKGPSTRPAGQFAALRAAFQAAQQKHLQLVKEASTGAGIDRHLMGLRIAQTLVLQRSMPVALTPPPSQPVDVAASASASSAVPVTLREAVQRAQAFSLLTSQMVGDTFLGGFAHVSPHGYGVCYYVQDHSIRACVSSFETPGDKSGSGVRTNAKRFGACCNAVLDVLFSAVESGVLSFAAVEGNKSRL
jgi:hypothetical protein